MAIAATLISKFKELLDIFLCERQSIAVDSAGQTFVVNATDTTGAGAGATLTGSGNDMSGILTLTPAGTPGAGIQGTINFGNTLAAIPKSIILTPANAAARALAVGTQVYALDSDITTGLFKIRSGAALVAATVYKWNYFVPDALVELVITATRLRKIDHVSCTLPLKLVTLSGKTVTIRVQPDALTGQITLFGKN